MAHATGSLRDLIYAQEWELGVDRWGEGASSIGKGFRNTGDSINLTKNTTQSSELTGDRAIRYLRHGNETVSGDVSFEFAPVAFDDFLASALGGTWGTASATGTLTMANQPGAGETITIGSAVFTFALAKTSKYHVVIGGTLGATQANLTEAVLNYCSVATLGAWVADVSTVTARYAGTWANAVPTTDTLLGVGDGFTGAVLADGADGDVVKQGTALFSYSIEKGFTDIDQYGLYRGCVVNTLTLDVATDGVVTGTLAFIGSGADAFVAASNETGTVTAPSYAEPFSSHESEILIDGLDDCIVTGLSISIDNGVVANYSLCGPEAVSAIADRLNATGTLTMLFESDVHVAKFISEATATLKFTLSSGGNSYEFYFPKIKYTGGDTPVSGGGVVSISMPFQALYDDSEATAVRITRTLGA
jgi:hypothetical protein